MKISDNMAKVVHRARELGWVPDERNKTARAHFYFNHPTIQEGFSIYKLRTGGEIFTVGHQSSSRTESAIEWLEALSPRNRFEGTTPHLDRKVTDRLRNAGFVVDPIQRYPGPKNIEIVSEGMMGKKHRTGNAHVIELHYHYNGSGYSAFGGAKEWPVLDMKVSFQEGEEELRNRLACILAETVDQYLKNLGKR